MHIVILHDDVPPDAPPDQLDVFVQADVLAAGLAKLGHTSARLPFTLNLDAVAKNLRRAQPGAVINLVESVAGQGRLVCLAPALLDSLGLPYTGSGTEAMFITSSKVLTKRLLRAHGIPTAPWVTATVPGSGELPLPARYVVKSVWEEASVGLEDDCVVAGTDVASLRSEIHARAGRLGGEAFAELYIAGREFNLSVLGGPDGPEVLPPAEIHFVDYPDERPKLVGYRAKWDDQSFEYHHTPRGFDFPPSDRPLLDELCRLARECWLALGLRGYVRVDFRVDEAGQPWVLEINANPCLSPDAGFVAAADRAGLTFEGVVERILADVG
jgi:D-alanine-D-alanine ligase